MIANLRQRLEIPSDRLEVLNAVLGDPGMQIINDLLDVVAQYGTPEAINAQAEQASQLSHLLQQVAEQRPEYLAELHWLKEQVAGRSLINMVDYRRTILGDHIPTVAFAEELAVTLEISACQYFPWIIAATKHAIARQELMPSRFIQVRQMKEQEADGDLCAILAAMQIIGASFVATLDTKGTDGSNIHLNGAATITGYFGGIGQPNAYALQWVNEYLYYYTHYGVRQVLNLNPGTVLLGYLLHRLGVDIEFKISVFMGNDNPYSALWTLLGAKLFARDDGSTPLVGFNWSNSVNNDTIIRSAQVRQALNWEQQVRFEHHITETWKSIVRQPYDRREELLELAKHVPNISAKHEGGDPEIEQTRQHPSDILDYFRSQADILATGDWEPVTQNFLDKLDAVNHTARMLTAQGFAVIAAQHLHG
ncbi:hypothetical protein [Pantanalinema sp. GBBB05]|uniref:hypothetical protein n=1 Tax=Pantanalinema sp. GBBB05 TaxID=2604139 RepID=UPI001DA38DEB|nr:hypothetical protein [Pantanalinema sp. GBBB05]